MQILFYTSIIGTFKLVYWILSFFNQKAKARLFGLKNQRIINYEKELILYHCASAGEYEQVAFLIKEIQNLFPNTIPVVSFFSPSGKEWFIKKNISIDAYYLPFDTPNDVESFLNQLNPKFIIISKNEFWFNFFSIAQSKKIPQFLVAAAFSKNHFSLKYRFTLNILNKFRRIYTLDPRSLKNCQEFLKNVELGGDPRIDQIMQSSQKSDLGDFFKKKLKKEVIIYGSVHKEDVKLIKNSIKNNDYHHIIVPHEIDKKSIAHFQKLSDKRIGLYSEQTEWTGETIIIDQVGILSSLYSIGNYSYIGGGFGKGIHNILEAAAKKNILFCGPNNGQFPEARHLASMQSLIVLQQTDSLIEKIKTLNKIEKDRIKLEYESFFNATLGTSKKIALLIKSEYDKSQA